MYVTMNMGNHGVCVFLDHSREYAYSLKFSNNPHISWLHIITVGKHVFFERSIFCEISITVTLTFYKLCFNPSNAFIETNFCISVVVPQI